MKKERDEKKEREARLLKRQQLKTLSQSLVARRNLGEYMGCLLYTSDAADD